MIFADKVIRLRKKNGWSQEELADKMSVSRQAVSKWESAQTVPDLSKILQLSQLFGVTTDYLLKDELESEEFTEGDEEPAVKKITLAEANEYLEVRSKASVKISIATYMCIIAVIPLIVLGAASENPAFPLSENLAGVIGLITLFVIVAAACAIFIYCGFKNAPYEFMEKDTFDTEYGVKGMVREKMNAFHRTYVRSNIIGTCVCVLSPIPLFIGAFTEKEFFTVVMLGVTMLIAGAGVVLFITAGVRWASMQRLLQEGEYSFKEKKRNELADTVSLVYWLAATAIYLGISFVTEDWKTSWIVWPVAGVLFAAVYSIFNLVAKKNEE